MRSMRHVLQPVALFVGLLALSEAQPALAAREPDDAMRNACETFVGLSMLTGEAENSSMEQLMEECVQDISSASDSCGDAFFALADCIEQNNDVSKIADACALKASKFAMYCQDLMDDDAS